jgi:hypothetical protein
MTKQELKNGNIIEWEDESKSIVKENLLLDILDLSEDCTLDDYSNTFDDLDGQVEWEIMKIYDNIIDMNLLWERPILNIKDIGYEYKGFKLGQVVVIRGERCNIVGFDEKHECNFYILVTTFDDKRLQFKDNEYATATLDVADSQLVAWIREYDIQTDLNNGEHRVQIEENECMVEPTPKVKLPKYVRIVKSSSEFYWYKNKIGKVYKVKRMSEISEESYIVSYKGSSFGYYKIDIVDCEPVSKEELMQIGMKVKVKNKFFKVLPKETEDKYAKFKDRIFTILDEGCNDFVILEEDDSFEWNKCNLKPYLGDDEDDN